MTGRLAFLRNPISFVGIAVTTASAVLFVIFFLLQMLGYLTNPYVGILTFVTFPLGFVIGLLLIPIGVAVRKRRVTTAPIWPLLDFNDPSVRRWTGFVAVATLANIVLLSMASYGAVHYMESNEFCGQVCHQVMGPELAAYQVAPHARVPCVDCHVGSGATHFASAKISGTRQLLAVLTDTYARPIPTPVHNLRPARDTCEQCHWPEKFHGETIKVVREFADDEQNTETVTTLRLNVGGGSEKLGVATGIHWHMNIGNEIQYIATDEHRQVIPYVRLRDREGRVREFRTPGVTEAELAAGEPHEMDCMDCHNRPSHTFAATPQRAVDQALAIGRLDPSLPFLKREAVAALSQEYGTEAEAMAGIAEAITAFYQSYRPEAPAAEAGDGIAPARLDPVLPESAQRAVQVVQAIYGENVFPSMGITWGTYSNEMGHTDSPGCFRCHDGEHVADDGSVIRQDCDVCHSME